MLDITLIYRWTCNSLCFERLHTSLLTLPTRTTNVHLFSVFTPPHDVVKRDEHGQLHLEHVLLEFLEVQTSCLCSLLCCLQPAQSFGSRICHFGFSPQMQERKFALSALDALAWAVFVAVYDENVSEWSNVIMKWSRTNTMCEYVLTLPSEALNISSGVSVRLLESQLGSCLYTHFDGGVEVYQYVCQSSSSMPNSDHDRSVDIQSEAVWEVNLLWELLNSLNKNGWNETVILGRWGLQFYNCFWTGPRQYAKTSCSTSIECSCYYRGSDFRKKLFAESYRDILSEKNGKREPAKDL